jgi:hypothetical protein
LDRVLNVLLFAVLSAVVWFSESDTFVDVQVAVPDVSLPAVNVSVPKSDAPVVNVTLPDITFPAGVPTTVVVEPAPVLPAEVVYRDRTVEVERVVKVPACLDYTDLPYFDLANALSVAFPGAEWSLSGSHIGGLTWLSDSPQPDMTAIIGGWLTALTASC